MTDPADPPRPTAWARSRFRRFVPLTTRWMDNDAYGHLNNVVYLSLFDTAVNSRAGRGRPARHRRRRGHRPGRRDALQLLRVARLSRSRSRPAWRSRTSARRACASRSASSPPAPPRRRRAATSSTSTSTAGRAARCRCRPACSPSRRNSMTVDAASPTAAVEAAITTRRSVRAFLPTPVPRETIERILESASRAPSGTNTQPWKVYVLTGDRLRVALANGSSPPTTTRRSARATPRSTPTTRPSGARPSSSAAARSAGTCTAARHRQDRQGAHARAAPPQLRVLRRAGRPDVHDRPRHAPGQLARLRHVPAERDGRGARPRARHLPAGGVHAVPPHHHRRRSACRTTSSSSAACRSAAPTPTRSRTRWSPSASRSRLRPLPRSLSRHRHEALDPRLPPHLSRHRRSACASTSRSRPTRPTTSGAATS